MVMGPDVHSWRSVPQMPPHETSMVSSRSVRDEKALVVARFQRTSLGAGGGGSGMVSMRKSRAP